jgi:hypothetical protein
MFGAVPKNVGRKSQLTRPSPTFSKTRLVFSDHEY